MGATPDIRLSTCLQINRRDIYKTAGSSPLLHFRMTQSVCVCVCVLVHASVCVCVYLRFNRALVCNSEGIHEVNSVQPDCGVAGVRK